MAAIALTDIRVEPRTVEGQRRNDIAVRGRGVSGRRALDYDLKIYTLHHANANSTTTPVPVDITSIQHSYNQSVRYLDCVDAATTHRAPKATAEFRAIVLSAGGLMSSGTADEMVKWKREIGTVGFERIMRRISLELLKSRARLFEV